MPVMKELRPAVQLKESPNIPDNFSRSGVVLDKVIDGGFYLVQLRTFRGKKKSRSLRIKLNCSERLVQFMGQRSR
jgi:hypothetical protein